MKDARGHGSNPRGGSVYLTPSGRSIMPSVPFRDRRVSDAEAASVLSSGGEKSVVVPTHSGTHNAQGHEWGSPEALRDFSAKYGKSRGFASGRREINRLRRKGQ